MISRACLEELRAGATLAHSLPLQLRLRHDGSDLVAVARPPFPPAAGTPLMTPCSFRSAVGEAWRLQQAGQPVRFCGLADGARPVLEVVGPAGAEELPGGIHRLPWPDGVLTVFATAACPRIADEAATEAGAAPRLDRVTGVTLVALASADHEAGAAAEVLEGVLARVVTSALLAELQP